MENHTFFHGKYIKYIFKLVVFVIVMLMTFRGVPPTTFHNVQDALLKAKGKKQEGWGKMQALDGFIGGKKCWNHSNYIVNCCE